MNIKMTIKYDGEKYKGWQRLGGDIPTVQGKIEAVLSAFFGKNIEISGAGRTDAGVHALNQVASFSICDTVDLKELKTYLNRYLPKDIAVISVSEMPEDFHARFSAKSKTYVYRILTSENPFERKYSMPVFEKLDINEMKKAAGYFVGTHDFTAFTNAKSKKKSRVRTIYETEIKEISDIIEITVKGNGFLHNMVRRMVGLIIEIGLGRLTADSVPEIISSLDRSRINLVAEAGGLFLKETEY